MIIKESELLLLAEGVVARYVKGGKIPLKEADDIKMGMVEKFLHKQHRITSAYSGRAKIRTYCISILNRMCAELIRSEIKYWNNTPDFVLQQKESSDNDSNTKLFILDEVNALEKIINLFDNESAKVRIFFAYYYKITVNIDDLESYDPKYKKHRIKELLAINLNASKAETFETLAKLVNIAENKSIKPDAARMWFNKITDRIIYRLNGSLKRANYDKESLQVLFEYYYFQEKKQKVREFINEH